jgi:transcription termination factor Rho
MWFNFKNYPFIGCVMHIGSLPLGPKTDMQGFHVKYNQKNHFEKRSNLLNPVAGHLEILDRGFGFLRSIENNYAPGPTDTFVPAPLINKMKLREGLFIEGRGIKGDPQSTNLKLIEIERINGMSLEDYARTEPLQSMVSINPCERFVLAQGPDDLMGKALDMIVPIGRGQRGLVISPPKSGKTTILQHMANSITANYDDAMVFVLLIDERPEEVTAFKRELKGANVLFSSADQSVAQHMRMTRLAMNTAIGWTEAGRDVVVFIDSLTRMARAFNTETQSYGRTLTGGLGANAMAIPRQIFGAARNLEGGGSLSIIATILVATGSRMDDIIFQEFKGTGNMDLVLSRKCAEKRIWPAIDINKSGTRKEDLLLDQEAYQEVIKIRKILSQHDEVSAMEQLLDYLRQSKS